MMKREIRFRGKRIDNGEWVYGDLENPRIKDAALIHCYRNDGKYDRQHKVEIESVGQFTGVSDRNNREIYEGDIIKTKDRFGCGDNIGYIAWLPQECGFVIVWKKYDSRLGHRSRGGSYRCDPSLEIVGNLYDNPELVKGGKNGK